jgi:nuclear GTP-binding protein
VKVLSKEFPTLAFHASISKPFGKGALIQLLRQFASLHPDKKQISVGFIGYPNVGKSSVINTLRSKKVCNVAPIPGETKVWKYITLMKRIFLIDCPGVVYYNNNDSETNIVLKGVVRVENLHDPQEHIPGVLERVKAEYLKRLYGIDDWEDHVDFLTKLARKGGRLFKGGEADLNTVARMVLHDWLRGKIPYFNCPPFEDGDKPPQVAVDGEQQPHVEQIFSNISVVADFDDDDVRRPEGAADEDEAAAAAISPADEPVDWDDVYKSIVAEEGKVTRKRRAGDIDSSDGEDLASLHSGATSDASDADEPRAVSDADEDADAAATAADDAPKASAEDSSSDEDDVADVSGEDDEDEEEAAPPLKQQLNPRHVDRQKKSMRGVAASVTTAGQKRRRQQQALPTVATAADEDDDAPQKKRKKGEKIVRREGKIHQKEPRLKTNTKKAQNYYTSANVKNRNRDRRRPRKQIKHQTLM